MKLTYDKWALAESLGNSRRLLRMLTMRVKKGTPAIYKAQGAVFAKGLYDNTLPMTMGGKAGGEARVIRDVRKIFKPVQSIPFAAFVHAKNWQGVAAYDFKFRKKRYKETMQKGDYDRLPYILQKTTASERMAEAQAAMDFVDTPTKLSHKDAREPLIPYTGKTNKVYYVKGKKRSAQGKINSYANLARYAVGKMVGGWRTALQQLGGSTGGLPFSGKGLGWGSVMVNKDSTVLEVGNAYGNFNNYADKSSEYASLFTKLQSNIADEMRYLLFKTVNELKMR